MQNILFCESVVENKLENKRVLKKWMTNKGDWCFLHTHIKLTISLLLMKCMDFNL